MNRRNFCITLLIPLITRTYKPKQPEFVSYTIPGCIKIPNKRIVGPYCFINTHPKLLMDLG